MINNFKVNKKMQLKKEYKWFENNFEVNKKMEWKKEHKCFANNFIFMVFSFIVLLLSIDCTDITEDKWLIIIFSIPTIWFCVFMFIIREDIKSFLFRSTSTPIMSTYIGSNSKK